MLITQIKFDLKTYQQQLPTSCSSTRLSPFGVLRDTTRGQGSLSLIGIHLALFLSTKNSDLRKLEGVVDCGWSLGASTSSLLSTGALGIDL